MQRAQRERPLLSHDENTNDEDNGKLPLDMRWPLTEFSKNPRREDSATLKGTIRETQTAVKQEEAAPDLADKGAHKLNSIFDQSLKNIV
jgi:hypothetical protein